ncbi:transcriptional regulator, TetR family [Paenibacillus algorifonticola]|uniref:Transcriptional regulator, TetR family n=1 Tax=Paenibacillus algorifonticola TaxID=684063 RepID=A0A1I2FKI1_9BACL|nr:TetR/AcrR family transcriptional regulator [Paenibacillus algorifonticola]SFF05533.1 transcriptional regulator, TetR family [Paenibacillus algorifonticola]
MSENHLKIDRRIVRSRYALREALLALMADKPFQAISITEIVEHAGYNRGTFYANYENKEALLDEITTELLDKLLQSFRAPYEHVEVFNVSELPAHAVTIFNHIYEHSNIYTILMKNDVLPNMKEKMLHVLKQISMAELLFPTDDIDRELLATYSMSAVLGLVWHWIETGFKHPPAYMQEQLVKIIHLYPNIADAARTGKPL